MAWCGPELYMGGDTTGALVLCPQQVASLPGQAVPVSQPADCNLTRLADSGKTGAWHWWVVTLCVTVHQVTHSYYSCMFSGATCHLNIIPRAITLSAYCVPTSPPYFNTNSFLIVPSSLSSIREDDNLVWWLRMKSVWFFSEKMMRMGLLLHFVGNF